VSPERDEPTEDQEELYEDVPPRSIFAATWFRVVLVVIVLGVIGAVAVPYVLDWMNPPPPPRSASTKTPFTSLPSTAADKPMDKPAADKPFADKPLAEKKDPPPPARPEPRSESKPSSSSSSSSSMSSSTSTPSTPTPKVPAPAMPRPAEESKPTPEPKVTTKPTPPASKPAPAESKAKVAATTESPSKPPATAESPSKPPAVAKTDPAPKSEPKPATTTKPPTPKPAAAKATPPSAPTPAASGPFWVQVGAFKDPEAAKRLASKLRDEKFQVEESVKATPAAKTSASAPSAAAPASPGSDQYDVFVTGMSVDELNKRLAGKGLAAETSGAGVVVKPSLPLRDAVSLSKDLAVDGFKVQVKRAGGSSPTVTPPAAPSAAAEGGPQLYRVRVGSFSDRAAALAAVKELEAKGYKPYVARGDQ
jgi:cell division septation protein DedD